MPNDREKLLKIMDNLESDYNAGKSLLKNTAISVPNMRIN